MISGSSKTDYAEKFLDTLELIIGKVNLPFRDLAASQVRVASMAISILGDMIEHGILEHRLTYQIMIKKYQLFKSMDLAEMDPESPLTREYCRYLFLCRMELEDLELEEKQVNLMNPVKTDEESDALDVFKYLNSIVMTQGVRCSGANSRLVAKELSKHVTYIMDYGV